MTIGELFAGIGGIGLGFKKAGFNICWANDNDAHVCVTYRHNFPNKNFFKQDIEKLDPSNLPKVDIITAGFPCQPFSIAGNRKGFSDERGSLFFQVCKFIDFLKPKVIFLENVKNLVTHDNCKTFKTIQNKIQKLGYYLKFQILNTAEYSKIPQNRERIYIVCFSKKENYYKFEFPKKVNKRKSIADLIETHVSEDIYYKNTKNYDILKKEVKKNNVIYQWRRTYVRENKNGLCPTLTANMGMGGHNVPIIIDSKGIRKLTPKECLRFQGFPNNFIFPKEISKSQVYKQIGNSVSVPVITAIAKNIKKALQ
jgi:DNA (cytosine-5)-methyltransferase 1